MPMASLSTAARGHPRHPALLLGALKAGVLEEGRLLTVERGTLQGAVIAL
jgi:hypothetical protein